jgi:hypothetical protein
MNKEFVSYNQALSLKELGFDEPCFGWFGSTGIFNDWDATDINAPLYQQAFRWCRKKHNLEGIPQRAEEREWYKFWIYELHEDCKIMIISKMQFNTYEEAEDACLNKLIEIVKNKQ